ncbi:hypothetical protein MSPP1_001899 [Malassezia sp. CBS 17886]|nr:hypothetical protein MSPP1_001899 [Malassezia sp. CBS 17886]
MERAHTADERAAAEPRRAGTAPYLADEPLSPRIAAPGGTAAADAPPPPLHARDGHDAGAMVAPSAAASASPSTGATCSEYDPLDIDLDDVHSLADSADSYQPPPPPPAATGELTLAAVFARGVPWHRRALLLSASFAINLGLPFINGVMLGFGEIFARAFIAPWLGFAPPLLLNRWSPSPADVPPLSSIPTGGFRTG